MTARVVLRFPTTQDVVHRYPSRDVAVVSAREECEAWRGRGVLGMTITVFDGRALVGRWHWRATGWINRSKT